MTIHRRKYQRRRTDKHKSTLPKIAIIVAIISGITILSTLLINPNNKQTNPELNPQTQSTTPTPQQAEKLPNKPYKAPKSSLFVPYWTLNRLENPVQIPASTAVPHQSPQFLMYFGIAPTSDGSIQQEAGSNNIQKFAEMAQSQTNSGQGNYQTLLTIRMINESVTSDLLENTAAQESFIKQAIQLAKSHRFAGIVLDLEHSVLPTEKVVKDITAFTQRFQQTAKSESLIFAITLYGDVVYRQRPYDLAAIGEIADYVLIMGYDFHKSFGEPGPNFPAEKGEKYVYDITTLAQNFTSVIPANKLIYIFGLYGYEWIVDDQNRPLKSAKALTLSQIKHLIQTCTDCTVHDPDSSAETHITWKDRDESPSGNLTHVLWFENEQSIEKKYQILQNYGIEQIGYWAAGY